MSDDIDKAKALLAGNERLLLVEWEGKYLIQHHFRCPLEDVPKLDQFATDQLIPRLGKTLTRGGQVTSAAYLQSAVGVPGRFKMLELDPPIPLEWDVQSFEIVRRIEV